jgi:flagellar protein FliS
MSFLNARIQYRRTEEGALPDLADPHQIVLVTLRELHKSLATLQAAQAEGQRYPSNHVTKGLTAVYVLQSSLDFEKGGEIADNLYRVYEFVRLQIVAAFQKDKGAQLTQARDYIGEILSAWQSMPAKVR